MKQHSGKWLQIAGWQFEAAANVQAPTGDVQRGRLTAFPEGHLNNNWHGLVGRHSITFSGKTRSIRNERPSRWNEDHVDTTALHVRTYTLAPNYYTTGHVLTWTWMYYQSSKANFSDMCHKSNFCCPPTAPPTRWVFLPPVISSYLFTFLLVLSIHLHTPPPASISLHLSPPLRFLGLFFFFPSRLLRSEHIHMPASRCVCVRVRVRHTDAALRGSPRRAASSNVCRSCFQIMSILPLCRWYTDGVFIFLGPWREWFWQTLSPWSPLSDNFMLRSSNAAKHNGTADLWAYHLEFWLLPFPVWYFPHRLFFYDPFHMSNPLTCLIYSSGKGTKICVCSRIAHWQPKVNLTPPQWKLSSEVTLRFDRTVGHSLAYYGQIYAHALWKLPYVAFVFKGGF